MTGNEERDVLSEADMDGVPSGESLPWIQSTLSWIRITPMRTKVMAIGLAYFSLILLFSSNLIPGLEDHLVTLGLLPTHLGEVNRSHIEGWLYPTYDLPVCERPSPPPLWYERGYGFVNHTIVLWVYYTADFSRVNQRIAVEILNQSVETINVLHPGLRERQAGCGGCPRSIGGKAACRRVGGEP